MYSFFNNYTGDGAPSFSKFARESGLTMERLESFRKNAEFDRIWRECKEIRKDIIIDRALCKRADASFAKFLLSEEGGGGGEDAIDLTITVIDQRMKIDLTVTKKQKSFIDAKETEVLFSRVAGGGSRMLSTLPLPLLTRV